MPIINENAAGVRFPANAKILVDDVKRAITDTSGDLVVYYPYEGEALCRETHEQAIERERLEIKDDPDRYCVEPPKPMGVSASNATVLPGRIPVSPLLAAWYKRYGHYKGD